MLSYKGIDINCQDKNGRTPLMNAYKKKLNNIVSLLLSDKRIDLNLVDRFGKSFLLMTYKNCEIFSHLVHANDIDFNIVDKKGYSPLHLAVKKNYYEDVSFILNSKRYKIPIDSRINDGSSLMHLAIPNKSMKLLNILEEHGLNYNLQDKKGLTPLMKLFKTDYHKTCYCFIPFKIAVDTTLTEIWIELMKKESIDINLQDNKGI